MAERRLRDLVEGAGAVLGYGVFRLLPLDWASALGGALARGIGPHLAISRRALRNLRRALPELGEEDARRAVRGMWDNLGRVVAEYPHLGEFRVYAGDGRIAVAGAEHIRAQGAPGRSAIFFSAHFGNWEVATLAGTQAGLGVVEIYRAPNNWVVDRLINRARAVVAASSRPRAPAARGACWRR